ncbi:MULTISPECIES: phage protease [unclassified Sphingomonas]|uniref:phage protease n=1 Tax=unclassified Sphingomonas TaxID=196159 RepID=UPI0009EAB998|nr:MULTISPECIES: phage protease [unclassified Sphingomonas]
MAKAGTGTLAACASAISIAAGATRIQLMPIGRWFGRDGRGPYELRDQAHARDVIAATLAAAGSIDLMIDYDHAAPKGVSAPAAGWIKQLHAQDDGIWADVEWTPAATAALQAREYRYISPWFTHDKAGKITRINNAALVNIPNFELAAVAAAAPGDIDTMDIKAILSALGLAEDATQATAIAAIDALKGAKTALSATASALGLAADADASAIATAAATAKSARPDPAQFVPKASYDALAAQVKDINDERATAAVDAAIEKGKVAPSMRQWALDYVGDKGLAAFAGYVELAPVLLQPGAAAAGKGPIDPKSDTLTSEEEAVASQMGLTNEQFLKARKEGL